MHRLEQYLWNMLDGLFGTIRRAQVTMVVLATLILAAYPELMMGFVTTLVWIAILALGLRYLLRSFGFGAPKKKSPSP